MVFSSLCAGLDVVRHICMRELTAHVYLATSVNVELNCQMYTDFFATVDYF